MLEALRDQAHVQGQVADQILSTWTIFFQRLHDPQIPSYALLVVHEHLGKRTIGNSRFFTQKTDNTSRNKLGKAASRTLKLVIQDTALPPTETPTTRLAENLNIPPLRNPAQFKASQASSHALCANFGLRTHLPSSHQPPKSRRREPRTCKHQRRTSSRRLPGPQKTHTHTQVRLKAINPERLNLKLENPTTLTLNPKPPKTLMPKSWALNPKLPKPFQASGRGRRSPEQGPLPYLAGRPIEFRRASYSLGFRGLGLGV